MCVSILTVGGGREGGRDKGRERDSHVGWFHFCKYTPSLIKWNKRHLRNYMRVEVLAGLLLLVPSLLCQTEWTSLPLAPAL